MSEIDTRLAEIRARIAQAATRAGRVPADIRLIAVSKTFPIADIRAAYEAGQRDFGEIAFRNPADDGRCRDSRSAASHRHLQSNNAHGADPGGVRAFDDLSICCSESTKPLRRRNAPEPSCKPTSRRSHKHGDPLISYRPFSNRPSLPRSKVAGLMLLPPCENPEMPDLVQAIARARDQPGVSRSAVSLSPQLSRG